MSLKLALDTTSSKFSFAVSSSSEQVYEHVFSATCPSSRDALVLELDSFLKKIGVLKSNISEIVVNHGPGSFSGIRAGLGVSLALRESLPVSVQALSGLYAESLRREKGERRIVVVLQPANSEQDYFVALKFNPSDSGEDFMESILEPGLIDKENFKIEIAEKLKSLNEDFQSFTTIRRDENFSGESSVTSASLLLELSNISGNIPRIILNKKNLEEGQKSGGERLIPLYVNKLNALTLKERGLRV